MEFLIRFVQIHETFRKPEIEALAVVEDVHVNFLSYLESVSLSASSMNIKKDFSSHLASNLFLSMS